jgi:fatty-acid peroxygenase
MPSPSRSQIKKPIEEGKTMIPTVGFDSTLALVTEGYPFIYKRCQQLQSEAFQTRLLFQKTICLSGAEAASLFYDTEKFVRKQAAPNRLKKTLTGEGGVQGLDGSQHRHRKAMFMALMGPKRIAELALLTQQQWQQYAQKWQKLDSIVLFDQVQEILCCAVCQWAGVPLTEAEVSQRTADLAAMINGSGAIGIQHIRGRLARQKNEAWMKEILAEARQGRLSPPPESALSVIGNHRDLKGNLLDEQTAAVELLNVLRPTVAIGRYITFAALALHEHPEWQQKLKSGNESDFQYFIQEVRRFFPFFPFAAARVKQSFDWQNFHFPTGTRVLLDLYGTNRDAKQWQNPDTFKPERFMQWDGSPFNFIPQGGGDFLTGHRCAGEWITIELMKVSVKFLTQEIDYTVPPQDLRFSLKKMPTLPKSRFIISQVRPLAGSFSIGAATQFEDA